MNNSLITGGSNYLVRRPKIIFCNVGTYMFPSEEGQKHLVRDTKVSGVAKRRVVTGQRVRKSHV